MSSSPTVGVAVPFYHVGHLGTSSPFSGASHSTGHHHTSDVGPQDGHGHTHESLADAGLFSERDDPVFRSDWTSRAFTVGVGGPVGSGKTALVLALCELLRDSIKLAVVTNDIFTREDWEFLVKNKALSQDCLAAVETGGCPHAAIREDISLNTQEVKRLTRKQRPNIIILESGGDNLAANFSRELADYIIYVIDVAGGDKIPRKGGPGITQSDLLVVNKTDLAEAVGASLVVMERESNQMRDSGPTIFAQAKHKVGVSEIAGLILSAYTEATGHVVNGLQQQQRTP
eukprot:GHVS01029021.1.p1 GENE.GHVS01029021.1~~GHVS01029021.1.p1  ORF type:complete len:321 (-),score=50.29 GHVS01029021.1:237-1097(-)